MRVINLNEQINLIVEFIKSQLISAGFSKLIVGLSGGIESNRFR